MSFKNDFMGFFGLGPANDNEDDAYYAEDERYDRVAEDDYRRGGERVAAPADRYADRRYGVDAADAREYAPTIVEVSLVSYEEAKKIGEPFRDGDAVVFELTDADRGEAKRIIDFAAGLCFGLSGQMTKLTRGMDTERNVFAIVPTGAGISSLELERAAGLR